MKFTGEICLVCQNEFTDEDDIVVCPECGTPHHRECWFKTGCCVNTELHKTGYEYKTSPKESEPENEKPPFSKEGIDPENTVVIPMDDPFQSEFFTEEENNSEGSKKVLLGGSDIRYYIAALGKNCAYYLNRFAVIDEGKRSLLFNPMAFLFPFAWSIYRKMFKAAAVVLALYIGLAVITAVPVMTNKELINGFNEAVAENPENIAETISNISMYMSSNGSVQLTEKQAEFVALYENMNISTAYIVLIYLYSFGLRTAAGLFATKFYFKKIRKRVMSVESNGALTFREKIFELASTKPTVPFFIAAVIGFLEFGFIQL